MTEIKLNMSVSIPDEIYEKFLSELGRDGFVFAKFGEYSLVLSKWDGEYDLSVDGKHSGTGRRQGSAKAQAEEHAGSNPAHPTLQLQSKDGKVLCKCGHWIGIVGTKWQHMDEEYIRTVFDDAYTLQRQIKYREKCYTCDCAEPTPVEA